MAKDEFCQRIDIADECRAESRCRLRSYLDGVRVHGTPFLDAREVLMDEVGEWQAVAWELAEALAASVRTEHPCSCGACAQAKQALKRYAKVRQSTASE